LLVALITSFSTASAEPSLSFPDLKIGLPALSLAEVAQAERPSDANPESALPKSGAAQPAFALQRSDDKFVIKPDDRVDYKLAIKVPDASIDYRMIVKDPNGLRKK